jgi:hypothetical protein
MKKISELMDELGFDPDGSLGVKEAFIKYLIKASEGVNVLTPTEKVLIKADPIKIKVLPQMQKPEQLAFDFHSETKPRSNFSRKAHK